MGEPETKQITILIGGRPYPLKIQSNSESVIRRIVREVNEKTNKFQLDYPNRDKQDCLAMTALALAVELDKLRQSPTHDPRLLDGLGEIDALLDTLLSS